MLSDDSNNPYAPPRYPNTAPKPVAHPLEEELADRGTRLVATILDSVFLLVALFAIMIPAMFWLTSLNSDAFPEVSDWQGSLLSTLYVNVVFLLINGYLLYDRGQTLGKYIMKIQVVDQATSELLSFSRVCFYRHLWPLPISLILLFTLGSELEGMIINLMWVIDSLFIFGGSKLCLHDQIAYSRVVRFQPDRPRIN